MGLSNRENSIDPPFVGKDIAAWAGKIDSCIASGTERLRFLQAVAVRHLRLMLWLDFHRAPSALDPVFRRRANACDWQVHNHHDRSNQQIQNTYLYRPV
jgi:chromosome condensin MukBEF complex kleisin-like MukF subunit